MFFVLRHYQHQNQAHNCAKLGNIKALFHISKPCETLQGFAESGLTELKEQVTIPSRKKDNALQADAMLLLLSTAPWAAFLLVFSQKSHKCHSHLLILPCENKCGQKTVLTEWDETGNPPGSFFQTGVFSVFLCNWDSEVCSWTDPES